MLPSRRGIAAWGDIDCHTAPSPRRPGFCHLVEALPKNRASPPRYGQGGRFCRVGGDGITTPPSPGGALCHRGEVSLVTGRCRCVPAQTLAQPTGFGWDLQSERSPNSCRGSLGAGKQSSTQRRALKACCIIMLRRGRGIVIIAPHASQFNPAFTSTRQFGIEQRPSQVQARPAGSRIDREPQTTVGFDRLVDLALP